MIQTEHFTLEKRNRPKYKGQCFKCGNFKGIIKQEGEYTRLYCAHCGELLHEEKEVTI